MKATPAFLLQRDHADECNCPACEKPCLKSGKKCFIPCAGCQGDAEEDGYGPITSKTRRIKRDEKPTPKPVERDDWADEIDFRGPCVVTFPPGWWGWWYYVDGTWYPK